MSSAQDLVNKPKPQKSGIAGSLSPSNVLLLKAALLDGDKALAAYKAWRPTYSREAITYDEQVLLPLLHNNLVRMGIVDAEANRFRGVRRFVWVNNLKRMQFAQRVFKKLNGAGIPFITLKGAALFACYIDDTSLRPIADVDVLVRKSSLIETVELFAAMNLQPEGMSAKQFIKNLRLHATLHGWSFKSGDHIIDLHWKALHLDGRGEADARFWQASRMASLDGVGIRVLDPAHQLLHVFAHAVQAPSGVGRWPADAAMIIRNSPDLSFETVVEEARQRRLSAIAAQCLGFLADQFDLSIPRQSISRLWADSSWSERVELRLLTRQDPNSLGDFDRLFLDYKRFHRGIAQDADRSQPWALLGFFRFKMGVPSLRRAWVVGLQLLLGRPAFLRRILGVDRYRILPSSSALPKTGETINLAICGSYDPCLMNGWSYPDWPTSDPTGRWTDGPEATIAWSVRGHQTDLELSVDGIAMVHPKAPEQVIELWANDRRIARWQFHFSTGQALRAQVTVPAEAIRNRNVVLLTFVIHHPQAPAEISDSLDRRLLGFHLRSIALKARSAADQPPE